MVNYVWIEFIEYIIEGYSFNPDINVELESCQVLEY